MNWKFWTWPAQIRELQGKLEIANCQLPIAKPLWSEPYDVTALRARLGQLPKDDKLFPLLAGYFDACVIGHADTKVSPDMTGQVVGRINALAELRTDWGRLWQDAHTPPKGKKAE